MRLLLDTHALLWALTEPGRLSDRARSLIADRANEILVSAASSWEIGTKHRLGRLPMAAPLVHSIDETLDRLGATALPVTHAHAMLGGTMAWDHRDPFDRMLAAQSIIEGVPLVTADTAFAGVAVVSTIWD